MGLAGPSSAPDPSRLGEGSGSRQGLPPCVVTASDVEGVLGARVVAVEFDPGPRHVPLQSPDVTWCLCTFKTELGQHLMVYIGNSVNEIKLPDWTSRSEVHEHSSGARIYVQCVRIPPAKQRVIRNVYIVDGSRVASIRQTVGGLGITREYETLEPFVDQIIEKLADPEKP